MCPFVGVIYVCYDVCVRAHNTVMVSRNAENTLHIVKSRCKNISEQFRFCFGTLLRYFHIVFFTCGRMSCEIIFGKGAFFNIKLWKRYNIHHPMMTVQRISETIIQPCKLESESTVMFHTRRSIGSDQQIERAWP